MNAGNLIRKLRQLKGYSQEYMAIQLGISNKTYVNIENGKSRIDLERFFRLSQIFEINPIDFLKKYLKDSKRNCHFSIDIPSEKDIDYYKSDLRKKEAIIHYLESKLNINKT